jgi:hypothetical protein
MADNTKSGNLWRRGDRLLVLSRQAREQGHEVLADDILDRAVQLLEEARVLEQRPEPDDVPPAPSPVKSDLSEFTDPI